MKHLLLILSLLLLTSAGVFTPGAAAQNGGEWLAPPAVDGEAVYIPFPVAITVDGDLSDWSQIQPITVTRGPYTSGIPGEDDSFTFQVAADMDNLYLAMTMPDKNIITGQHGADYWNEDSLEFYVNASGDLFPRGYGPGIFQARIVPADIGNTDPTALVITGVQSDLAPVSGYVFKTAHGWGFEAAIALAPLGITPANGLEIGFQAQANGASTADRDTKLIWSLADTSDSSWTSPDLFGIGVFFEVGSPDVPPYSPRPVRAEPEPELGQLSFPVKVNQTGYYPTAPKYGMMAADLAHNIGLWQLIDIDSGEVVLKGVTTPSTFDEASGDNVMTADFSAWTTPGNYRLSIDGTQSAPFVIGTDIYARLKVDALRFFYLSRSGIPLEEQYAGEWARAAGHLSDGEITCWKGTDADGRTWPGCDYTLDGSGGWYDAGDYGKYVVNGGISVWTLLNLYELYPDAIPDGAANIPESGNGVADVLDEARWEMEWLLKMQIPAGEPQAGMAFHKLHDRVWSGLPLVPPTEFDNDLSNANDAIGRYVYEPTTAATLNLAATAAQCARIWAEIDPAFAAQCLQAAQTAWTAANDNPEALAGNTPGNGGGNYDENDNRDEFFWAAAELYITTGEQQYADYIHAQVDNHQLAPGIGGMWWGDTQALGMISLATVPNALPAEDVDTFRNLITNEADFFLAEIGTTGYRVPLALNDYVWGSNSNVANHAIIMALAYQFTGDTAYLDGVTESMDYLLGTNALSFSFVTGYGEAYAQHEHHRFWANQGNFPPPPPGALAGGPNADPSEDTTRNNAIMDSGPAKRYVDMLEAFSTNEVAINWNSPLMWVAAYLDEQAR
jgi:endoglucanase